MHRKDRCTVTDSTGADDPMCKLTKESCPYRKIPKSKTASTSNTMMQKSTYPMVGQHTVFWLRMTGMGRCMQKLRPSRHTGNQRINLPHVPTRRNFKFLSRSQALLHMPCVTNLLKEGLAATCTGRKSLGHLREFRNRHSPKLRWAALHSLTMEDRCIEATCLAANGRISTGHCLKNPPPTTRSGPRTGPRFLLIILSIRSSGRSESTPTMVTRKPRKHQFLCKGPCACRPPCHPTFREDMCRSGTNIPQFQLQLSLDYRFRQSFRGD